MTTRTTEEILAERGSTHGPFGEQAPLVQNIKGLMRATGQWALLPATHREALDMIAHKMGRILVGNPQHRDHWDDIAGYARLASGACVQAADAEMRVAQPGGFGRDKTGVTDPGNFPTKVWRDGADQSAATYMTYENPATERLVPRYGGAPLPEPAGPGTPDDGGHHEPRAGRGVQALTASLVAGTYDDWPANVIISTTDPVKQGADSLHWVLDRRLWPRAEVDGFFLALPRQ